MASADCRSGAPPSLTVAAGFPFVLLMTVPGATQGWSVESSKQQIIAGGFREHGAGAPGRRAARLPPGSLRLRGGRRPLACRAVPHRRSAGPTRSGLPEGKTHQRDPEAREKATEDKLRWIDAPYAAGLREIEICSFVRPKLMPQMADAAAMVELALMLRGFTALTLVAQR